MPSKTSVGVETGFPGTSSAGILDDARWDVHLWRFNDDALAVRDVRKLRIVLTIFSFPSTKGWGRSSPHGIFTGVLEGGW
jgi:hypothetical protein